MYGVPANLDLTPFHGTTLDYIQLAQYIIYFHFDAPQLTHIGVEGGWELRDASGQLLDQQVDSAEREAYRLHVLLGREVTGSEVSAPNSFALVFGSGHWLRVFDDSAQYESFHIQPGDLHI
jgi:hypothetical protein